VSDLKGILDAEYGDTLLGSFVGDDCLDEIRQLNADLGARPYRVFLVRTRWSGKRRGQGVESVLEETEILPTPKVAEFSAIQRQLLDIGTDEQGGMNISEISPRYTEWQLLGLNPDGSAIAENETFSWEISLSRGDAGDKKRRRFMVQGVPGYNASRLEWTVRLIRAGSDRAAGGNPT